MFNDVTVIIKLKGVPWFPCWKLRVLPVAPCTKSSILFERADILVSLSTGLMIISAAVCFSAALINRIFPQQPEWNTRQRGLNEGKEKEKEKWNIHKVIYPLGGYSRRCVFKDDQDVFPFQWNHMWSCWRRLLVLQKARRWITKPLTWRFAS